MVSTRWARLMTFCSLIIRKELFHRVFDISSSYSFDIDGDNKNNFIMNIPDQLSWKQHFKVMVGHTLLLLEDHVMLLVQHGSLHVHPKISSLSRTHPIRYECKNVSYYSTITEAVSSAKDGDRIIIHRGVYCEQIVLYKNVILIGADSQGIISNVCINSTHV